MSEPIKPQIGDRAVSELDPAYQRYKDFVLAPYGWKPMSESAWARAEIRRWHGSQPTGIRLQSHTEHKAAQARIRAGLLPID